MARIIGGFFLQGIGGGAFYLMVLRSSNNEAMLVFLAVGLLLSFGGLSLVLSGLREFLLRDLIAELQKITALDHRAYLDSIISELREISRNISMRP